MRCRYLLCATPMGVSLSEARFPVGFTVSWVLYFRVMLEESAEQCCAKRTSPPATTEADGRNGHEMSRQLRPTTRQEGEEGTDRIFLSVELTGR